MTGYDWTSNSWVGKTLRKTGSPDEWTASAHHRKRIMQMVERAFPEDADRTICVWGAGKCNDIELNRLVKQFAEVHLVDIDAEALQSAIEQNSLADSPRVILHAGLDLCGIDARLAALKGQSNSESEIQELLQSARSVRCEELGQYDLVLSTCVISQIICSAVEILKDVPISTLESLVISLRNRHVQMMIEHLQPGGRGVLVTDVVSSDTLPELAYAQSTDVVQLLTDAIKTQNHFHGLNPAAIEKLFNQPPVRDQLSFCRLAPPWLWTTPGRIYAVVAVAFEKISAG